MTKHVYRFGGGHADGRADMRELLGGKGANLAEMNGLGLASPSRPRYAGIARLTTGPTRQVWKTKSKGR